AHLWDNDVIRPRGRAEACLRRLVERPHSKVLATADLFAGEVITVESLQGQPESLDVQLSARWRIGRDDADAGNELDLHPVTSRVLGPNARAFPSAQLPQRRADQSRLPRRTQKITALPEQPLSLAPF